MAPAVPDTQPRSDLDIARSEAAFYAKTLLRLRDALMQVQDHIEDEGDRVYFGSSNDADALREIARKIDGIGWDRIMESSQPPVDLYDIIAKLRTRIGAAEGALKALVDADALAGIRPLVAGWNGDNSPVGPFPRHPPELGVKLPTNCGAVYALDEALQAARAIVEVTDLERTA